MAELKSSPGEDNLPIRLTSSRGWLAVLAVAVVVIGGGVWGATAELSRSVAVAGLLTSPQGAISIQTPVGGQVTEVRVRPGDQVTAGGQIARLASGGRQSVVRSPAAGQVFSVPVQVGEVVAAGSVLAGAERGDGADGMVAVLFLPAEVPADLAEGAAVQLTVQSVPVNEYGVLRGRIRSADPLPSTHQEIAEFVGDTGLAATVAGGGSARRVIVELLPSPRTPSGYQWSTPTGPPFRVGSRAVVTGNVPQPPERPIEWVIPK